MTHSIPFAASEATPTRSTASVTRRRPRPRLLRLAVIMLALEGLVAGGLRLGVGEPPSANPQQLGEPTPAIAALALPAPTAPALRPAAFAALCVATNDAPEVHLAGGPTGFGTF